MTGVFVVFVVAGGADFISKWAWVYLHVRL